MRTFVIGGLPTDFKERMGKKGRQDVKGEIYRIMEIILGPFLLNIFPFFISNFQLL